MKEGPNLMDERTHSTKPHQPYLIALRRCTSLAIAHVCTVHINDLNVQGVIVALFYMYVMQIKYLFLGAG